MYTNEEFGDIYRKYRRFSVGIAYKIVKDMEIAEDISQEVFFQLYRLGEKLDLQNEEKIRALIAIASANKAKDHMKSVYAKRVSSLGEATEALESDPGADLDAVILQKESNEYRKMALMRYRNVNPMNYAILIKVKYLDIPVKNVAEEYGITENNVNNRILRARIWLETELHRIYH